jgi:pyocin large subunit-like protein
MEKKQTAVEQLIHEMKSLLEQPYVNPKNALNDCINLAYNKMQMEKEQHFESYRQGNVFLDSDSLNFKGSFEQYYNETYGGQDEK